MKKIFLLIAFVASFAVASQAQAPRFGVKAGLNLANLTGDGADLLDLKMKPGFYVGVQGTFDITESIGIQPEVVFSAQGAKDEDDVKYNLNYLNIPVLAKYRTPSGFFAETGPQIGFLMSAKAKDDNDSEDIKDDFKGTDFSWVFGLGYQTQSGFGVNGRFNLGLSNIIEDGDDDFKVKNSVIQVGVFYVLGSK